MGFIAFLNNKEVILPDPVKEESLCHYSNELTTKICAACHVSNAFFPLYPISLSKKVYNYRPPTLR